MFVGNGFCDFVNDWLPWFSIVATGLTSYKTLRVLLLDL